MSQRTGMRVSALTMRGAERDACRRTVLGDRAFGHVHVNIDMAIEILRQAEQVAARAHVAHAGLRRFLHHVAQFAGEREPAFALHQRGFGGEHLAADFGPGQAGGEADFVLLLGEEVAVLDDAEIVVDVRRVTSALNALPFSTTLRATLRQTLAISRSRLRTPASCV